MVFDMRRIFCHSASFGRHAVGLAATSWDQTVATWALTCQSRMLRELCRKPENRLEETTSFLRRRLATRQGNVSALRTTASSTSPSTGLERQSTAPECSARTRVKASSPPVTKIIGRRMPLATRPSCSSNPLAPGRLMSRIKHPSPRLSMSSRKASAEAYGWTRYPSAERRRVSAVRNDLSSSTT